VSNLSIYAYRQERQTLVEVITSSIHKAVQELNKQERKEDKLMESVVDTGAKTLKVLRNKINLSNLELRFDGCTRFLALPNNRLLIIMENQQRYVAHFKFDQADIEIDSVYF
jgi:hypothetical protein